MKTTSLGYNNEQIQCTIIQSKRNPVIIVDVLFVKLKLVKVKLFKFYFMEEFIFMIFITFL